MNHFPTRGDTRSGVGPVHERLVKVRIGNKKGGSDNRSFPRTGPLLAIFMKKDLGVFLKPLRNVYLEFGE